MAPGSRLQELTAKYMQNPRRFFVPLANEYRKARDLDRAIALCREHLSSQPGHMSGHIVLARAYYEKGDIAAAREVFLTSVELDDENLIALRHLGDIARARNDVTEARQWYARVLDADPQNEEMERVLRSLAGPDLAADAQVAADAVVDASATMPFDAAPIAAPIAAPVAAAEPPTADRGGPAEAAPTAPVPALEPAIESALSDPTPPGLRAILFPDEPTPASDPNVRGGGEPLAAQPDPRTPLDRFDLSTLNTDLDNSPREVIPATEAGIQVDDGVGFLFDELDELVDPAAQGTLVQELPPVTEADFSAGIATPTEPPAVRTDAAPDELLSRPAFGALASFASWRTAQERETPTAVPSQPAATAPVDDDEAADGLFAPSIGSESTATAPEFVTETMAALYAQQGFVQQALDVYRTLLARSPDDQSLRARVVEMERALSAQRPAKSLDEDADNALQFGELDADVHSGSDARSMLESMYDVSPPGAAIDDDLASAFDSGWNAPPTAAEDDWFGDTPAPDLSAESGFAGDEMFGVSDEVFGLPPARAAAGGGPDGRAGAKTPTVQLEAVFGAPAVITSDATAGEMLLALAAQMVGRLPKEAPTLPVPDILELPSAVPGDEATGASPAPLLSFDRFFSGSGSPPRARIDTPVVRQDPLPWVSTAPTPVPSLSPTFGGLPVIPPPASTPAVWAGFDQFVPPSPAAQKPAEVAPTEIAGASTPVEPPESVGAAESDAISANPSAHADPIAAGSDVARTPMEPQPSAVPERARTIMPAALRPPPPAAQPEAAESAGGAEKPPASEFHRWLEGLS
jgi:cytochrome c-type biogenesis protein CcmH/NrfG